MRQVMIHGYITECSETAFRNAGKSGAAAFLNAGKEWTLFRACSQGFVR
jgi:hypothetical protein